MAATAEREEETIVERTLKGPGVDNGPDGRGDDPPPELLVKVKWRPETLDLDLHVAGDVGGDDTGDGTGEGAGRDAFFTAVNVRAPPNAPGTAEEWYARARQALTGPKSRAHRHFSFTLDRAGAGASTEATFKWSWHEPTSRTDDPMPACVTAAAKGTRRVGVARMRGEAFVASNRHRIFAAFALRATASLPDVVGSITQGVIRVGRQRIHAEPRGAARPVTERALGRRFSSR